MLDGLARGASGCLAILLLASAAQKAASGDDSLRQRLRAGGIGGRRIPVAPVIVGAEVVAAVLVMFGPPLIGSGVALTIALGNQLLPLAPDGGCGCFPAEPTHRDVRFAHSSYLVGIAVLAAAGGVKTGSVEPWHAFATAVLLMLLFARLSPGFRRTLLSAWVVLRWAVFRAVHSARWRAVRESCEWLEFRGEVQSWRPSDFFSDRLGHVVAFSDARMPNRRVVVLLGREQKASRVAVCEALEQPAHHPVHAKTGNPCPSRTWIK
ncbi:MAG: MauE/DoxX family redox-associated membrane protein [Gemmatimonadales bacterium]